MAQNLRRNPIPTDQTMARFMYFIIKQLDVRGVRLTPLSHPLPFLLLLPSSVICCSPAPALPYHLTKNHGADLRQIDWNAVASDMEITNGHAARMRFARFKNQIEGVQPKAREPRSGGARSGRPGPGRPPKRKKEEEDDKSSVKREVEGKKVKAENDTSGGIGGLGEAGHDGLVQPVSEMQIGQRRIKREASEMCGDGEVAGGMLPEELERRKIRKIKSEPIDPETHNPFLDTKHPEEGVDSAKAINLDALLADLDAPGERVDEGELVSLNRGVTLPSDDVGKGGSAQSTPVLNTSRLASASRSPTSYSQSLPPTPIFNEMTPIPAGNGMADTRRQYSLSATPVGMNSVCMLPQPQHLPAAVPAPANFATMNAAAFASNSHLHTGYQAPHPHPHPPQNSFGFSTPSTMTNGYSVSPSPTPGYSMESTPAQYGQGVMGQGQGQGQVQSYTEMLQAPVAGWQQEGQQYFGGGGGNGNVKGQGGWDGNGVYQ